MYQRPNYLVHYGVLGMKWGQRRSRKAAADASTYSEASKKYKQYSRDFSTKASNSSGLKKAAYTFSSKKYARKSKTANSYSKYSSKMSKKIENRNIELAGGKKVYDRVAKQSTPKLVGKSMIIGTYGTLNYERARAKGYSRGRSYLAGLASETLNSLTGGFRAIAEPRLTAATKETKK